MLEFMMAVVVTVCMTCGLLLRYYPFRTMVTAGQKKLLFSLYAALCLLNLATATWVFHRFGPGASVSYLHTGGSVFAIITAIVNICLMKSRFGEHLFALGIVRTIHFLLLSTPAYIITLVPGLGDGEQLILFLGIYTFILLITHWPFQRLLCKTIEPFLQLESNDYWKTIFFIPIAFFIASAIFEWGAKDVNYLLQLISSLVSCSIMILMCLSIVSDHQRLYKHQLMEKQLEGQKLHYTELKIRVEDARKLNHNLKHHIAAIRGFIDQDDKEGISRYCDELTMRISENQHVPYTGNVAVDGVLYHYIQLAQQENINLRLMGTIHSPGIADIDLCAALGNALDNAIAGCKTVNEKRSISVISQSEKQLLSIMIRNNFDGKVKEGKNGLMSTKKDMGHGLGLASMESFCKRYGGSFEKSWDDNSFTVMFILPLKETQ